MHVYVCLFASMLYLYFYLSRFGLCHALCPPWAFACRYLGPLACQSLGPFTCEIHLSDVIFLCIPFLHSVRCSYACLPWFLSLVWLSLHLCMLAYMFKHESVCRSYSNPWELWTPDPNLHLSSSDTFFCLITYCMPLFNSLSPLDSLSFSMLSFYLFLCLSIDLLLLSLHVHAWSMDNWSKGVTS